MLRTARDVWKVNSPDEYRERQAEFLARNRLHGGPDAYVHTSAVLKVAYVNDGTWVIDCDCGSGCAVDTDDALARCFGCGATYNVLMPDNRDAIEAVLLQRGPRRHNRHWYPHESAEQLQRENEAHGIGGER